MQSVAEYAPEIMDQLFHDEGIFMPRVNYMDARIAKGFHLPLLLNFREVRN